MPRRKLKKNNTHGEKGGIFWIFKKRHGTQHTDIDKELRFGKRCSNNTHMLADVNESFSAFASAIAAKPGAWSFKILK